MTLTPAQAVDAAIVFRTWRGSRPGGAAGVRARADIQRAATAVPPSERGAAEARRLMAVSIADMPADPDDVSLLLDVIGFRHGLTTRADCWRRIGINPERGRALLTRNKTALDWPIWRALVAEALG